MPELGVTAEAARSARCLGVKRGPLDASVSHDLHVDMLLQPFESDKIVV